MLPQAGSLSAGKFFFTIVTNTTFSLEPAGHNGDNPDQDFVCAGETRGQVEDWSSGVGHETATKL